MLRDLGVRATERRRLLTIEGRAVDRAAEIMRLAGVDRWFFMRVTSEHGVPVVGYSVEDLKRDVATLEDRLPLNYLAGAP